MENDFLENGHYYHIYNRANNYEKMFFEEKNYHYFLKLLEKYLLPVCEVYAYCLLPNHFHFLVRIKDKSEIPEHLAEKKTAQHFANMFNSYTKSINKMYRRRGSLFQEHFGRKRILDDKQMRQSIIYIHRNPLKHGLTTDFPNYEFSSYRSIISKFETKIERDKVLEYFDGPANFITCHKQT